MSWLLVDCLRLLCLRVTNRLSLVYDLIISSVYLHTLVLIYALKSTANPPQKVACRLLLVRSTQKWITVKNNKFGRLQLSHNSWVKSNRLSYFEISGILLAPCSSFEPFSATVWAAGKVTIFCTLKWKIKQSQMSEREPTASQSLYCDKNSLQTTPLCYSSVPNP